MKKLMKLFMSFVVACSFFAVAAPVQQADAAMISREKEIEMGRATAQELEAKYGVYNDYALTERINSIGQRLAAVCGRDDIEFQFKILNVNEVNALACPGGFIYVYKGLIDYMPTDNELAGVLGHEVGHVAKKHSIHAMEKQMFTALAVIVATRGQGAGLASTFTQALFAGYSRTDERGADKEGVRNSIEAGFNPYSMLITANKLNDLSEAGGGSSYGVFSSHPEPEARVKRVLKQLEAYNIHPDVNITDANHASVTEDNWTFNINQTVGNMKASYRAYLLAGGLWQVRQRGTINPYYFTVRNNGSSADIYYDDIQVHRVYSQDAGSWGSASAYASACVDMFRNWAEIANANDASGKYTSKKKKK